MTATYDLILTGGTVVNHDGQGVRDIGVRDGRIAAIGDLAQASAGSRIDCRGLHILPGVIDSQVHFREPGLEHKEDLETGSRAAVLGGVTAVFEMPNTNPLTTSEAALADKVKRATGRMHCDFAFWVGGTRENAGDVGELERLPGAAGIKVFMGSSTGDLLVEDDEGVASILQQHAPPRRLSFRGRVPPARAPRRARRGRCRPRIRSGATRSRRCAGPSGSCGIARQTRARIHVLHISTAEEIAFLEAHKDVATCEVTPHHLTMSADDYARLGTLLQMNPPVRDASASRRHLAWHRAGHRRRARLRPRAAYAGGEGKALSGVAFGHDRRADAGADHARPCECRPPDAGAFRRPVEPWPATASSASPARAASPPATTPTSPSST